MEMTDVIEEAGGISLSIPRLSAFKDEPPKDAVLSCGTPSGQV